MIGTSLKVSGVIFAGLATLVWYQPANLLRLAAQMERGGRWLILQLRIRAWSKAAAMEAYRKEQAFHRKEAQ